MPRQGCAQSLGNDIQPTRIRFPEGVQPYNLSTATHIRNYSNLVIGSMRIKRLRVIRSLQVGERGNAPHREWKDNTKVTTVLSKILLLWNVCTGGFLRRPAPCRSTSYKPKRPIPPASVKSSSSCECPFQTHTLARVSRFTEVVDEVLLKMEAKNGTVGDPPYLLASKSDHGESSEMVGSGRDSLGTGEASTPGNWMLGRSNGKPA